jgi:nucleoside-diphosphate-sugar epimerase
MGALIDLTLTYVDIRDVADAHLKAMEKEGINGERIFIGSERLSMLDISLLF